jgi:hypothetical protein
MIGVKVYDHKGELKTLFEEWDQLGINLALVSPPLAAKEGFMDLARDKGVKIFLIIPTFYNEEALAQDTSLSAITSSGLVASDDWVRFICPNRVDFRKAHLDYIRQVTENLRPDGISIDFIRYFVFWEKVYPLHSYDDLPQTCFNDPCIEKFQEDFGIRIPDTCRNVSARADYILSNHLTEWTEFKCLTISGYVQDLVEAIEDVRPGTSINFHAVPWRSGDFQGAVRSIAGQDISLISPQVDYLSPMCYAHMVKRPPEWVHEVVLDMSEQVPGAILLPSIQVDRAYLDSPLSDSEFRDNLAEALKSPSSGVILWSWETLERSPEKMEIFRDYIHKAQYTGYP